MSERSDRGDTPDLLGNSRHSKHQGSPLGKYPRYHSRLPKCHGRLCCTWCILAFQLLILFIIAITIAGSILYAVFKPRMPKYSVEDLQIRSFVVATDATVSSQFVAVARATNPNRKIGIYYLDDSYLAVFYSGTELSRGELPAFYQGPETITTSNVVLTGANVQLSNKQLTLLNAQRVQGSIPLHLKADIPVKLKVGKMKTLKITFHVRCELEVQGLNSRTRSIGKKKCKVKL